MLEPSELASRAAKEIESGRYEDALGLYEQALLLSQSDPDLWNGKGVALRALGRYEEASECFNRSLELDPRDRRSS